MNPPIKNAPDGSMRPVWCSMLLPGIGQWMQHRRNAGTFYLIAFVVLGSLAAIALARSLAADAGLPGGPLGAVGFVYGANVIDTIRGRDQLRQKKS